jgi:hypothetical protein
MGSGSLLLSFLLLMVSGWVHRHQLTVIKFLQAENRLLQERLRGKRIRFTTLSAFFWPERPRPWGERLYASSTP